MKFLTNFEVIGNTVNVRRTHEKHFGLAKKAVHDDDVVNSFGKTLTNALNETIYNEEIFLSPNNNFYKVSII